jgi:hypothetical protein
VPGLDQRSGALRDGQQVIGLGQRRGDGLLDHHVNAAFQRHLCHGVMPDRRNDDRHRVDLVEE